MKTNKNTTNQKQEEAKKEARSAIDKLFQKKKGITKSKP
jgi:hypothetical protein